MEFLFGQQRRCYWELKCIEDLWMSVEALISGELWNTAKKLGRRSTLQKENGLKRN